MNSLSAQAATVRKRTSDLAFAIFLFAFGAYGLWVDHLHQLGEDAAGVHLHHVPAPIMCAALICASFVMLAALGTDYEMDRSGAVHSPSAAIGKWIGLTILGASVAMPMLG